MEAKQKPGGASCSIAHACRVVSACRGLYKIFSFRYGFGHTYITPSPCTVVLFCSSFVFDCSLNAMTQQKNCTLILYFHFEEIFLIFSVSVSSSLETASLLPISVSHVTTVDVQCSGCTRRSRIVANFADLLRVETWKFWFLTAQWIFAQVAISRRFHFLGSRTHVLFE